MMQETDAEKQTISWPVSSFLLLHRVQALLTVAVWPADNLGDADV